MAPYSSAPGPLVACTHCATKTATTRPSESSSSPAVLNRPNGVAFKDGDLYVAEVSRILRYRDIEAHLDNPPQPEIVNDAFPTDRAHGWKFIRFGPDGLLYVPVGAPCNICTSPDPYASIGRLDPSTGDFEVVSRGVRNSVGFDWHPETGEMWFTENGRDWMGDDLPPDELNRVTADGQHFGYPYCHGTDIADPEFGAQRGCGEFVAPVQELGPARGGPRDALLHWQHVSGGVTAIKSSSPNTALGTAAARSATASP